ncbi:MAG: chemotaxis-specific protein-glutamate methyltransferase CheB [Mycobacteriales bacterium]
MSGTPTPGPDPSQPSTGLIRILLVDGQPAHLRRLRGVLQHDAGLAVIGEAYSGLQAVMLVDRLRPDVVLMSLDLPDGDALTALEAIMADRPTPVVMHSTRSGRGDLTGAAMAAGAVGVVAGCSGLAGDVLAACGDELRRRLRVAGRASVITHPRGRLRTEAERGSDRGPERRPDRGCGRTRAEPRGPVRLLAIGASTGGPAALASLLGALPPDLDVAVLVIQHMAEGFIQGLADWLDSLVELPVSVASSGRRLQPGQVVVAPSGVNLVLRADLLAICEPAPATQFHVPGIDLAFSSVAETIGAQAVGVLLTGMGRDGAIGMRALRDAGAVTIGQDESTSAVFGMPAAAAALGAVGEQLALPAIAPRLVELVAVSRLPRARSGVGQETGVGR